MNIIYSGILAALSELFPNFGLSYYLPRNQDDKFYDRMLFCRILLVLMVWGPIGYRLYKVDPIWSLIAVSLIMVAFSYRIKSKWHDQDNQSGNFYLIGFLIIWRLLETKKSDYMNIVSILLIFIGGRMMGQYRKGDLDLDKIGRIIYSIGIISLMTLL